MGYRAVSSTENSVLPETTSHSPPKPSQDRPVIGVLGKRAMSAARTVLARPWARAGSAVTAARPRLITVKAVVTARAAVAGRAFSRSEEHTSELQSLMRNSYAGFCLKKKTAIKD